MNTLEQLKQLINNKLVSLDNEKTLAFNSGNTQKIIELEEQIKEAEEALQKLNS
jgi:hypothetical protein